MVASMYKQGTIMVVLRMYSPLLIVLAILVCRVSQLNIATPYVCAATIPIGSHVYSRLG